MAAIIRKWDQRPSHHFRLKEGAVFDNAAGLQDVLNSGENVILPPGRFLFGTRLNFVDFAKLRGASASCFARANYNKDYTRQTILEFNGAIGAGTTAINVSAKNPGVPGTDFSDAGDGLTDDLRDVVFENIAIDAGDADVGINIYRAGNGGRIGNVVALNAKKRAGVINGLFTARLGPLFAYGNGGAGWAFGEDYWNMAGGGSGEWACNNCVLEFLYGARNGLDLTFNETTAEKDGAGVIYQGYRGNEAILGGEGNDGYGVYAACPDSSGPNRLRTLYVENNMQAAKAGGRTVTPAQGWGTQIVYNSGAIAQTVDLGFHNSGFGDDLKIEARVAGVATADAGPLDPRDRLTIQRCPWNIKVQSNTIRYRARGVSPSSYSNKEPELAAHLVSSGYFVSGTVTPFAPSVRRTFNAVITRITTGQFQVAFDKAMLDTNYLVHVEARAGTTVLACTSQNNTAASFTFIVRDAAGAIFNTDATATVMTFLVHGALAA